VQNIDLHVSEQTDVASALDTQRDSPSRHVLCSLPLSNINPLPEDFPQTKPPSTPIKHSPRTFYR